MAAPEQADSDVCRVVSCCCSDVEPGIFLDCCGKVGAEFFAGYTPKQSSPSRVTRPPKLGGQVTPPGQTWGAGYPPRPNLGVRLPPHSKPAAQVTRRRPNPGYHQVQVTPPPGLGSQVTPPTARRGRGAARRGARASHRLVPRSIDYIAQKTGREKTPSTVFAQRSQTQPAWRWGRADQADAARSQPRMPQDGPTRMAIPTAIGISAGMRSVVTTVLMRLIGGTCRITRCACRSFRRSKAG